MMKNKIIINLTLMGLLFITSLYSQSPEKLVAVVPKYFPPQYSLDKKGKPSGFAIDILNKIAYNLNLDIEYVIKDSWPEVNRYIIQNHADIIPNIGISKKREEYLLFTAPLESFSIGIQTRIANHSILNYKDLDSKKIGVVEFNVGVKLSHQFKKSEIIVYKTKEEMLYALLSTEIDCTIYPIPIFNKMIADANLEDIVVQAGKPLKEIKRAIAVNINNPKLYKQISNEVDRFVKTKEYKKIYSKWYANDTKEWSEQSVINFFIFLVVIFIVILFIYKYYLTKKLNTKLEEDLQKRINEITQKDELMISQSRLAATGEILEMISHQWRQPLAVIQMAVNNIMVDIELDEKITNNKLKIMIDSVSKQTSTLSTTIDNFSNFSSLQSQREDILICTIIEEIKSIIKVDFDRNGISLEFQSNCDGSILILKNELIQVLLSIIHNAQEVLIVRKIKHAIIRIALLKEEDFFKVVVCDNAGGILESNINNIAKPYYSTKSFNSAGLGLYISKIIIEKHLNGKLSWINKNNGACFTIMLPIKDE